MPEITSPKKRIPGGSLILRCEVRGDIVYALLPEMTGSMDNDALATVLEMLTIQIGKLTELVMNERAKRNAAELPPDPPEPPKFGGVDFYSGQYFDDFLKELENEITGS